MADDEDHDGPTNCKSVAASKQGIVWKQKQPILPLFFSKEEDISEQQQQAQFAGAAAEDAQQQRAIGDGNFRRSVTACHPSADPADECGLELSLGLSLGGPVCKPKSKSVKRGQEAAAAASDQGGGETGGKEEDSPRSAPSIANDEEILPRNVSDRGISRNQAFWQELSGSREGLKQEKLYPRDLDAVREVHAQIQSDATIASLSPLSSPTVGRLSMHGGLIENWRPTKDRRGEETEVVAHEFWQQSVQEQDQANPSDEKPLVKDLLRVVPAQQAATASAWGRGGAQGGLAMHLFNAFNDRVESDPTMRISSSAKKSPGPSSYAVQQPIGSPGGQESGDTITDGLHSSADVGGSRQQSTGEASSQDESVKAAAAAEQGHMQQDAKEETKKQNRQEARKKRKALLEEQKLQKKAKKDVGGSGQSVKQQHKQILALGSKVSIGSREVSTGSPPDSQDGEIANSGLHRAGSSALWQQGGAWEGAPAASSSETPPDCGVVFSQVESGTQFLEMRRAFQHERDRVAKDKGREVLERKKELRQGDVEQQQRGSVDASYPQSARGGVPTNLHPGGASGALSTVSVKRFEGKKGQADASWVQSVVDSEMSNPSANHMAAELLESKEFLLKRLSESNGIQRRGDLNGVEGRNDMVGLQRKGLKYIESLMDANVYPSKQVPSSHSRYSLPRAVSLGGGQVHSGTFGQLPLASGLPSTSQFGPVQSWPNSVDCSNQDVNRSGACASAKIIATVEGSRGQPVAVPLFANGLDKPIPTLAGTGLRLDGTLSSVQVNAREDTIGLTSCSNSNFHSQEGSSIQGNKFQLGTTQSIPTTTGLVIHVGQEASSLKRGIAAGQMFGGTGSSPDLPWVTCTGAGPSGKTICGVRYRYQKGQVRIVCACHGRHMSPSEFVEHAGSVDLANPEKNIVVGPFSLGIKPSALQS